MQAIVTGCAGFIGSHLTESLLDDGHDVLGIDCFNDNYGRAAKLRNLELSQSRDRFAFVPVDLARGDLQELVDGCDVLFHLAAEPGVRASWGRRFETYVRNNVLATQHVLDAAASSSARVVYASSSSVYGQAEAFPTTEDVLPKPHSPYGVTKLAAEHMCSLYHSNHGLATVSLRYFSVYGPRQRPDMAFNRFSRAIIDGGTIEVYGDGHQTRDFTYVGDIVRATRAAAESEAAVGNVYNIGGGSRISVRDALGLLEEFAGKGAEVRYLDTQLGDVRDTGADSSAAQRDLGFEPATQVREGLAAEFEWMAGRIAEESTAEYA